MRDATFTCASIVGYDKISIHASYAGRDELHRYQVYKAEIISIHASYAGRDKDALELISDLKGISIHASYAGRDRISLYAGSLFKFQSTRPMRDATSPSSNAPPGQVFQSTRPMRDATHPLQLILNLYHISIHASYAGRDNKFVKVVDFNAIFQSTRPMRDATISILVWTCKRYFNPRVLCGTRRWLEFSADYGRYDFNPRVLCGTRLKRRVVLSTIV